MINYGAAKFTRRVNEQTASEVPSGTNEVSCLLSGKVRSNKMRSEWKVGTERAGLPSPVDFEH